MKYATARTFPAIRLPRMAMLRKSARPHKMHLMTLQLR